MNSAGYPDWLVVADKGVSGFVELKRPGKEPTPLQLWRLKELIRRGHIADWANTIAGVRRFLDRLHRLTQA
jgi:hypothetical protein